MSVGSWLYDKEGKVRKELHTVSFSSIDKLVKDHDAHRALHPDPKGIYWKPQYPNDLLQVKEGDQIRVAAKYAVGVPTDGWFTILRIQYSQYLPGHFLCAGYDAEGNGVSGGWIGSEMVVEWKAK